MIVDAYTKLVETVVENPVEAKSKEALKNPFYKPTILPSTSTPAPPPSTSLPSGTNTVPEPTPSTNPPPSTNTVPPGVHLPPLARLSCCVQTFDKANLFKAILLRGRHATIGCRKAALLQHFKGVLGTRCLGQYLSLWYFMHGLSARLLYLDYMRLGGIFAPMPCRLIKLSPVGSTPGASSMSGLGEDNGPLNGTPFAFPAYVNATFSSLADQDGADLRHQAPQARVCMDMSVTKLLPQEGISTWSRL